jgi:hypothetical protein
VERPGRPAIVRLALYLRNFAVGSPVGAGDYERAYIFLRCVIPATAYRGMILPKGRREMLRKSGLVSFGLFMMASAVYVGGRIVLGMRLGSTWSELIIAVLTLDRIFTEPSLVSPTRSMLTSGQTAMLLAGFQRHSPCRLRRRPKPQVEQHPAAIERRRLLPGAASRSSAPR